ncbi:MULTISPECIES: hypothetical protein [unclassified Bradyrhizobium]|uniref:hypothetical protein n=1 Tax=unclassified Bradyrhizobium TaxID=2631580 RepID=UPI001FFA6EE1|nr:MULTISPECIES: hypothetical protein [unclassified Bradyrhizobium]MCK1499345.1 hypothetical protein [Bradyrhizobium sp. 188]MCK1632543.1 hypothetical protein [Bradyrhizobium sp. 162]UPJ79087.1 hypothetical protein IVB17_30245 [Bradyrhizobium sp. 184]UPJ86880.1 hypothetical protein IVB16_30240 [Bradyrhizobium sp. 183]UPK20778.1 hypothetical protein IVA73_07495 [Bradyrhizobium sp. 131]
MSIKPAAAHLLLIGRQLYLLSQKKDVRIFLLDLGIDAKGFKLLGVQFEWRSNVLTLDGAHGNQPQIGNELSQRKSGRKFSERTS